MEHPVYKLNPFAKHDRLHLTWRTLASLGITILAAFALILFLHQGEVNFGDKDILGITCEQGASGRDCSYSWYSSARLNSQGAWIAQGQRIGRTAILFVAVPMAVSLLLAVVVISGVYLLTKISE